MTSKSGQRNADFETSRNPSWKFARRKRVITTLLLVAASVSLISASNAFAQREPVVVPHVETSDVIIDGAIGEDEYAGSYTDSATGVSVHWEQDGNNIYVGIVGEGTGWVAIGFGPENTGMDGANIIIGYVDDASGVLTISDEIGVGFEHHIDADQGGSDNIIEKAGSQDGGVTTIEFVFPLNSGDVHDQAFQVGGTYGFILAYQKSADDLVAYHSDHSASLLLLIEDPNAAPPEVPGDEEPVRGEPKATSLVLDLPSEALANGELFLSARLVDEDGVAVENAVVDFYVNTSFGEVKVGSAVTEKDGTAIVSIVRKIDGILAVRAEFAGHSHEGGGRYLGSSGAGNIAISGARVIESDPLFWAFPVTQGIIALVLGSVFSMYGFALYQVFQISRSSKKGEGGA